MNTIDRKYLLFNTKAAFEDAQRMGYVRGDAIVFIKDPKVIYTHGTYWDCSNTSTNKDFQLWLGELDLPTKDWVQEYITGKLNNLSTKSDGTINYIAGEGIAINNTTISAKPASTSSLGGMRLGYVRSGNNFPVQLNGQNQAYVHVDVSDSSDGSIGISKYYEMLFTVTGGEQPNFPTDSNMGSWSSAATNANDNQVVWMIVRLVEGDTKNPWEGPYRISGPSGENGVDGDSQEFIYRLSDSGTTPPKNYDSVAPDPHSVGKSKSDDDFVPYGWTDSPSGISEDHKYEWFSMRFKTHSKDNPSGSWSDFISPVLWSAYGKNGADGDGVEYIYYTSTNGLTPRQNPKDWINDSGFQRNEYIRSGTGAIDGKLQPNRWQDDPCDLETLRQGSKTYVSIRKKKDGVWQAYSDPALWSYYAKDGDAGVGLVADFDNDTMCVSLKSDGMNFPFMQTSKVYLYNGINPITCLAQIIDAEFASGQKVPNYSSYFSVQNGNEIKANIPNGLFNFLNNGSIFVNIKVTGTVNNAAVSRDITLNVIGIHFGEDGSTFLLKTNTKVIHKTKSGILSPSEITCSCIETTGKGVVKEWNATNVSSGFNFIAVKDGNIANELTINTESISTSDVTDNIEIRLEYTKDGSTYVVDQEVIYVVSDGVDGGLIPAVHYDIQPLGTDLMKLQNGNTDVLNGNVLFRIVRIEGTNYLDITSSNKSLYLVSCYAVYGSTEKVCKYYDGVGGQPVWLVHYSNTPWLDQYGYVQIIVKEGDIPVASTIVPVLVLGKDGKDGLDGKAQALNGAVMRFTVYQTNPTHAYNNGSVAENGVYYLDVVQYDNEIFKCVTAGTVAVPYSTDANGKIVYSNDWSKIETMNAAAFHTLLAKDSYIENLAAKLIIVYGPNGTTTQNEPVAGIVNGKYFEEESKPDNGIRIFAGSIPNSGNLSNTAFNVDLYGSVSACGGKVKLYSDGRGFVAGGKISWDSAGRVSMLVNPDDVNYPGSIFNNRLEIHNIALVQNPELRPAPALNGETIEYYPYNVSFSVYRGGKLMFSKMFDSVIPAIPSSFLETVLKLILIDYRDLFLYGLKDSITGDPKAIFEPGETVEIRCDTRYPEVYGPDVENSSFANVGSIQYWKSVNLFYLASRLNTNYEWPDISVLTYEDYQPHS